MQWLANICVRRPIFAGVLVRARDLSPTSMTAYVCGIDARKACGELVDEVVPSCDGGDCARCTECVRCVARHRLVGERR